MSEGCSVLTNYHMKAIAAEPVTTEAEAEAIRERGTGPMLECPGCKVRGPIIYPKVGLHIRSRIKGCRCQGFASK